MNKVVKVAVGQIGYKESPAGSNRTKYGKWFGLNGQPWCAIFLDWCFEKAGMGKLFPHNANAAYAQDQVVSKCGGKWMMKKNTSRQTRKDYLKKAKPGDIVTFDFGAFDAYRRHIGIVKEVKGNYLICIEGNTSKAGSQSNGGMVCEKDRSYTSVCAAVRPAWSTKSADFTDKVPESKETINTERKAPKNGDKCLDLSAWQGELSVDWFKAKKAAGYKSVILRSSYTKGQQAFTLRKDSVFDHNIKNAYKAGMNIGIYHFSQMMSEAEAKKEAEFCVKCIKPYKEHINLPVACDYEWYGRLTASKAKSFGKAKVTKQIDAFLNVIEKAGFDTMVYASLSVFNGYISADVYKRWKIWVAQYYSKCQYSHKYYLWQYTSNNGKLDENVFGAQAGGDSKPSGIVLPDRGWFQKGDKGDDVKQIQAMLNKANNGAFDVLPKLAEDGEYGEKTKKHVKLFQDVRHLAVDGEVGEKTLRKLKTAKTNLQTKACNFAVAIARDNSFAYGVGKRAHHYGCYFCGTNITGAKKAKKGSKWEKTYCCNPFVTAAYAHGAKVAKVLSACKKGSGGGMSPDTWTRYGFVQVKSIKYKDVKAGDIFVTENHVCMATGGGYIVEAGSEGWGAKSIAHKKVAKSRFDAYSKKNKFWVMRYPDGKEG